MEVLDIMEELLPMFAGFLFFALALSVVVYVFRALSLYTIAKRRGVALAWLAWIPLTSNYILGGISDQYQRCVNRKKTNRAMILLVLAIVSMVIGWITSRGQWDALFRLFEDIEYMDPEYALMEFFEDSQGMMLTGFFSTAISVASAVFMYIALFDVYKSCKPEQATVFLVLSILFGITIPFFLFYCRKYDDGMARQDQLPAGDCQNYRQNNWQGWQPPQQNYQQPDQNYRQPPQPFDTEADRAREPWNTPEE